VGLLIFKKDKNISVPNRYGPVLYLLYRISQYWIVNLLVPPHYPYFHIDLKLVFKKY